MRHFICLRLETITTELLRQALDSLYDFNSLSLLRHIALASLDLVLLCYVPVVMC